MATTRRSFTDEFKAEAVALLESSSRPLEQVARELGVQPSMLRNWRKRLAQPGESPPLSGKQPAASPSVNDQAKEIARLKRDNERLRMEKDILKKTLSIISAPLK
jgi:transposase